MKQNRGAFNYENYERNAELMQMGFKPPLAFGSGTTLVGMHFKGGVMIATDTRGTCKGMIRSSTTQKIHRLHNNIYCGGSGYAGDLLNVSKMVEAQLDMHYKIINQRRIPVACAKQLTKEALTRSVNRIMVSLIIAGVDNTGGHLYSVHFDGTTETFLFNSLGSGQLSAMGILESRWQIDIDEDAARELIVDAVSAGITNDLASGSSVDLCVIRNDYSVQLCTELLFGNLRSEKLEAPDKQPTPKEIGENWARNVTIIREKVFYLTPKKTTPPASQAPPKPKPPIRRDEVRKTAATTRLQRKRSANVFPDGGPPTKRRKKN